jgi:general secretion pathway protein K
MSGPPSSPPSGSTNGDDATSAEAGFALVAALWLVAFLALAASMLAVWVGRSTEEARLLRQRVQEETQLADAKAGIFFAFLVQPLSGRGLEVATSLNALRANIQLAQAQPFGSGAISETFIALDDRPYRFADSMEIQVQDSRGLINVNLATREEMMRLLIRLGIDQDKVDPLVAKLQDYVDLDDLSRLNGAERADYVREGLPPPPNGMARTIWEIRRVLGWRTEAALWSKGTLAEIATASSIVGYNLNTMPAPVLEIIAGMTAESAAQAVQFRRTTPLVTPASLVGFGAPYVISEPMRFIPFPADVFRVTFVFRPGGRRVQTAFQLTPNSVEAPWRIDYQVELASIAENGGVPSDPIPEFPDPAALLASR